MCNFAAKRAGFEAIDELHQELKEAESVCGLEFPMSYAPKECGERFYFTILIDNIGALCPELGKEISNISASFIYKEIIPRVKQLRIDNTSN
jgi:hypothetical protein